MRSTYYREYMEGILAAMSEGVKVVGTLAWSLYDNFEVSLAPIRPPFPPHFSICHCSSASSFWIYADVGDEQWAQGFSVTFGMQYCNFSDPALPRYYKASFFEYVNAFEVYQET